MPTAEPASEAAGHSESTSETFAVVFAVFGIAEVAHQINETRAGLAVLAATTALAHVATSFVAEQRATTAPS